jgi:hypothetical protein
LQGTRQHSRNAAAVPEVSLCYRMRAKPPSPIPVPMTPRSPQHLR